MLNLFQHLLFKKYFTRRKAGKHMTLKRLFFLLHTIQALPAFNNYTYLSGIL